MATVSTVSTDCPAFQKINNALIENGGNAADASLAIFSQTLANMVKDPDMFNAEYFYGLTAKRGDQLYDIRKSTNPGDKLDIYGCARQVISNYTNFADAVNDDDSDEPAPTDDNELERRLFIDLSILMGTRSSPKCIARVVQSVQFLRDNFKTRNEQQKVLFLLPPAIFGMDTTIPLTVCVTSTLFLCICWCGCTFCEKTDKKKKSSDDDGSDDDDSDDDDSDDDDSDDDDDDDDGDDDDDDSDSE